MSLSSSHGSRLPASAPGIWRPRLPTRDKDTTMQKRVDRPSAVFARTISPQFAHINPSSSSLFILRWQMIRDDAVTRLRAIKLQRREMLPREIMSCLIL